MGKVAATVALALGVAVHADIQLEKPRPGAADLTVVNERNQAVIDRLAQEYGFDVSVNDAVWAAQRRDFERAGDLERVLNSFLNGTNYVLSYRKLDDGSESISGVSVMGPQGKAGIVASNAGRPVTPVRDPVVDIPEQAAIPDLPPGHPMPDVAAYDDGFDPLDDDLDAVDTDDEGDEEREARNVAPPTVNDMLQNQARQLQAGTATARTRLRTSTGSAPAPVPQSSDPNLPAGIDQAELQRLTAAARQNVQQLAQALRQAERSVQQNNSGNN